MAAITPTEQEGAAVEGWKLVRYYGTSTANQADTMTTTACPKHKVQKLLLVTAVYSGSPTQGGVTTTLDSVNGAGYDALLNTGSANSKHTVYVPDEEIPLLPGDAVVVSVPAGGSGQTVGITVTLAEKAG